MKLNRETSAGMHLIDAYDAASFTIAGQRHEHSLVLTPDSIQAWSVTSFAAIDAEAFGLLRDLAPALVLIGTGVRQRFPAPAVFRLLVEARIGFEVMDTGSACRTYNLLAVEGRRVAAALLLETQL